MHPARIAQCEFWIDLIWWRRYPKREAPQALADAFRRAVEQTKGVTVLKELREEFKRTGGVTSLLLLKESHAALHSWPEECVAWVQLATCGDPTSLELFREQVTALVGVEVPHNETVPAPAP